MSDLEPKKIFREYMENYAPRQLDELFKNLDDSDGIMLEICFTQFAAMVANEANAGDSGLHLQRVSNNEVAVCDSSCPYWGYQCNVNEMFKECTKHRK